MELQVRAWHKLLKEYVKLNKFAVLAADRISSSDCNLELYSGVKDKNGVDIYVSDIVKLNDCFVAEVRFIGCAFAVITKSIYATKDFDLHQLDSFDDIELIGNINQNPELLK